MNTILKSMSFIIIRRKRDTQANRTRKCTVKSKKALRFCTDSLKTTKTITVKKNHKRAFGTILTMTARIPGNIITIKRYLVVDRTLSLRMKMRERKPTKVISILNIMMTQKPQKTASGLVLGVVTEIT